MEQCLIQGVYYPSSNAVLSSCVLKGKYRSGVAKLDGKAYAKSGKNGQSTIENYACQTENAFPL